MSSMPDRIAHSTALSSKYKTFPVTLNNSDSWYIDNQSIDVTHEQPRSEK